MGKIEFLSIKVCPCTGAWMCMDAISVPSFWWIFPWINVVTGQMEDVRKATSTLPLTAIVKTREDKVRNKEIHFDTWRKYEKLPRKWMHSIFD